MFLASDKSRYITGATLEVTGRPLVFLVKCSHCVIGLRVRVMVFNATFDNISVILWQSVLLVEKTTDLSQVTDKLLSHNVVSNTPSDERDSNSQLIV